MEVLTSKQAENPSTSDGSQEETYHFAIDVEKRKIVVLSNRDYDATKFTLLDPLPKNYIDFIGVVKPDEEIADDDSDRQIHCYECDKHYSFMCREHPFYRAQDRSVKEVTDKTENRALRTLPAFLDVRTSSIPNAGLGVFTRVDIPAGIVFGPYEGVLMEDPKLADHHGYAWEIRRTFGRPPMYIDGADPHKSNWIRYVNNARYESEQNLIAFQYNGQIYYRVFQPIDQDQELLVWYGTKYGNELVGVNVSREETKQRKRKTITVSKRNPFVK